ncbi:MAG: hypothetical protein A4E63_00308 [Syntrophorhabdus sp. PtaU1.Bin050]|nr:MAG: hypothetical protein A4E63_00308 [Syntrophorhabdus sp. PtaU1.Bin050]
MLPRRHILDVWEFIKDREDMLSMSTITLAIDAIKYLDVESKKDHLVEALELNEFICYMYPAKRPKNRSLLFHVVSDLLGLLIYGVPKTRKHAIDSIEIINYSEESMEVYPVIEVWNDLKDKVYTKKHGPESIVQGFVRKIRVEMDVMERYPFVEDIMLKSLEQIKEWLPSLAAYYDRKGKTVNDVYKKWWALWGCGKDKRTVLSGMIDLLSSQAEREYNVVIDKESLLNRIDKEKHANRKENEEFSKWYREGVNLLLKI